MVDETIQKNITMVLPPSNNSRIDDSNFSRAILTPSTFSGSIDHILFVERIQTSTW